jgi:hypothetical protein
MIRAAVSPVRQPAGATMLGYKYRSTSVEAER